MGILADRRAATAAFLARFPLEVHTILTDNVSEFADRFPSTRRQNPRTDPRPDHAFARACAARAIAHRLTQPFRPQTNGMVERFNRRHCERMILLLGMGRSACGERPCCDNQKIDEPETTE
jgi:transposase InsO family protein